MEKVPVKISYHRQRSSTARIREGKIFLRISNLASKREQEKHIDELLKKMMKQWEKQKRKVKLTLKSVFEEGELLLSTGVCYQIKLKKGRVRNCKVEKIGDLLVVLWPVEKEFDSKKAEESLWKFLTKDQVPVLEERLDELREGWLKKKFNKVRLRMVMSRWGSCDARRGIIMLSVKLLLTEPRLLDYVCVHELAHLKYQDHSDLFWDLVEQKMPDWKIQRKRLRQYE